MRKPIEFKSGNLTLRGDIFAPDTDTKNQAVLFLHGWTGRPNNDAAEFLSQNGYHAMTFSLAGHNNSDGDINTLSRQEALTNALDAYDTFVSLLPEDTKEIILVGNSFGGYLAPLVSAERLVSALSIRVPANYPDEKFDLPQMGQGHADPNVLTWRQQMHRADETKSLRALHGFGGPVQIVEAELDDLVPHKTVQSYAGAVADPELFDYHLMQGWPHSLGSDPERNEAFRALLLNWLNKL